MKKILLCTALVFTYFINAQNEPDGNTIQNAIEVDGIGNNANSAVYNTATYSGLVPSCTSTEDVFYKHTTDIGDNRMTIGMVSAGTTAFADINYQIFIAPEGDMNELEELNCDSYEVVLLVGGNFQYEIEDEDDQNTYYLRVYKASVGGTDLQTIMDNSTVTMDSQYDSTLSTNDFNTENLKVVVKDNEINLLNNKDYFSFNIYGLDGKIVKSKVNQQDMSTIDTSYLSNGLYILRLTGNSGTYTHKFVKR